ncbi:MAG: hypothetical protein QMD85_03835 [Candidatus Aenigmarchaeota archaeon]|nr:hypothetical protein [Candidatus Aenigmarchaeota archaeon]MDI6722687.1 hypothetical protein [Candidatus Aenigmarchaeota archaeon]
MGDKLPLGDRNAGILALNMRRLADYIKEGKEPDLSGFRKVTLKTVREFKIRYRNLPSYHPVKARTVRYNINEAMRIIEEYLERKKEAYGWLNYLEADS